MGQIYSDGVGQYYIGANSYTQGAPRPTKLEPFHDYILQRMAAAAPKQIAAPALLRALRELGYQGQLRSLQAFMSAHRPVPTPDPVVRFETPAGQQMQCDFVVFRRGADPLYAFTATLGFSRRALESSPVAPDWAGTSLIAIAGG